MWREVAATGTIPWLLNVIQPGPSDGKKGHLFTVLSEVVSVSHFPSKYNSV